MRGIISVQAGVSLRDGWLIPGLTVMKYSTTRVVSARSTTLLLRTATLLHCNVVIAWCGLFSRHHSNLGTNTNNRVAA